MKFSEYQPDIFFKVVKQRISVAGERKTYYLIYEERTLASEYAVTLPHSICTPNLCNELVNSQLTQKPLPQVESNILYNTIELVAAKPPIKQANSNSIIE